ncbi:MAG TPA: OsmC family protein [Candidatus Binatia bacterium]|nr:OsmC family protein [Candidatus Binatia bacterium]
MSSHTATLLWTRDDAVFSDGKYSRAHEISFDGGITVVGSSSPSVVKLPLSREDAIDPEEMFVAALASCHMLFFLDFARRSGYVVDAYQDKAEGVLGKDERGRIAVTQVRLNPVVIWGGDKEPAPEEVRELHHKSHEACFIANSFRGDIAIGGGEAH